MDMPFHLCRAIKLPGIQQYLYNNSNEMKFVYAVLEKQNTSFVRVSVIQQVVHAASPNSIQFCNLLPKLGYAQRAVQHWLKAEAGLVFYTGRKYNYLGRNCVKRFSRHVDIPEISKQYCR